MDKIIALSKNKCKSSSDLQTHDSIVMVSSCKCVDISQCVQTKLYLSSWLTLIMYFALHYVKELRKGGERRVSLIQVAVADHDNSL